MGHAVTKRSSALGFVICFALIGCNAGNADWPAPTDGGGTDIGAAGDGGPPDDNPDAGEADGGVGDAGRDAGSPSDAGWVETLPDSIDCNDPKDAATQWCTPACVAADENLGWATRVRAKRRWGNTELPATCYRTEYGLSRSFLWRAPYEGEWVIDSFGAEGSELFGIVDARCGSSARAHGCWTQRSVALSLQAGEPIVALTGYWPGEDIGPSIHQLNISPKVDHELGSDCADWADNDADGLPDCFDPDCQTQPECTTPQCANEVPLCQRSCHRHFPCGSKAS